MGIWSSPLDSVDKAKRLEEKLSQPWIIIRNEDMNDLPDSYELIGDDGFFDYISDSSVGTDMRSVAVSYLKKYLQEIDSFYKVDPEAVKIIKKIVKNWED